MDRQLKTPSSTGGDCISRPLRLPNNRDWLGAFTGVLLWLTHPYNWRQLNEADMSPEAAAAYAQTIIDGYFNEQGDCEVQCCEEPLKRVTEDGTVQTSTDGGVTWVNTPSADPRETSIQFAPLSGANGETKRCKAAENIVFAFEQDVDQLVAELGVYTSYAAFVLTLAGAFAVILSAGAFLPAVAALATAAIGFGASTIAATMTTEVYERMRCNLYCHMADNGTLTSEAIAAIKAQIAEDEASSGAADILTLLVENYGRVGLNNLATLQGAGDGDTCEECNCGDELWCHYDNFTLDAGDWVNVTSFGRGGWNAGTGWSGTSGAGPDERITIQYTLPSPAHITEIYFNGVNAFSQVSIFIDEVEVWTFSSGGGNFTVPLDIIGQEIWLDCQAAGGTTISFTEATISGDGATFEFGPYDCDE